MKWSPVLHNTAVIIIAVGVLALLGAWWTQLTGRSLWGMSQAHLFSDAAVLILLGGLKGQERLCYSSFMPRTRRVDVGNIVYHVLNRSTARLEIFEKEKDYQTFEATLEEGKKKYPMRILAYCLMPNHWHLVLHPEFDGQLVPFMRWLTMTHTHRWHAAHHTIGSGHLYQGRYKSFPVETDEHFLQLVRYVERNAKRAKLVEKVERWEWSSIYRREFGTERQRELLSPWPVAGATNHLEWVNAPQPKEELETIRVSIARGRPYGKEGWAHAMSERLGLQSSFRSRGRPKHEYQ